MDSLEKGTKLNFLPKYYRLDVVFFITFLVISFKKKAFRVLMCDTLALLGIFKEKKAICI